MKTNNRKIMEKEKLKTCEVVYDFNLDFDWLVELIFTSNLVS